MVDVEPEHRLARTRLTDAPGPAEQAAGLVGELGIGFGQRRVVADQQHLVRAIGQQRAGFEGGRFHGVAASGHGLEVGSVTPVDREQRANGVVDGEAERGGRQRLAGGQFAEHVEGAAGVAVARREHGGRGGRGGLGG
ncbi:hypothetical protein D3C72_1521750 [compost metagenome]